MRNFSIYSVVIVILIISALTCSAQVAQPGSAQVGSNTSWKDVEQAMGRSGTQMPDGVYRFSMPRSDLKVMIGNVTVTPALALGSWAAFRDMGNGSMVMGDLVLTENEINPVIQRLQQGNIEQTALHNHLLSETPRIMYLHIYGQGDAVAVARTLHDALALTKTPASAPSSAQTINNSLDTSMLDRAIGVRGKYSGNIYQFSVPRKEKIIEGSMALTPAQGVATGINFQPLSGGNAAIAGDFILTSTEVNPVIRALRASNINVTAIHNHMLDEEPRMFFLHIWATGNQSKLANGLKEALDKTNSSRSL